MNPTANLALRVLLSVALVLGSLWALEVPDVIDDKHEGVWFAFVLTLIAVMVGALLTFIWSCC